MSSRTKKNQINLKFYEIIKKLEFVNKNNRKIKILDWGCGRGELVKFLIDMGYDAYGVELNSSKKKNYKSTLKKINSNKKIFFINEKNETNFPDKFFDLVITNQVIEHISNKNRFIYELGRILKKGGYSYNILPAKYRINEVHYNMPFVHWMPKNKLRKYLIFFFNFFKFYHWDECKKLSFRGQVNYYFNYSIKKTYYLNADDLFKNFEKQGFQVIDQPIKIKLLNNLFFRFIKNMFIYIEFLAIRK
ncbi:MAG: hypothetical protein CMA12_00425 [Euryarchaeota archaeon]|nr:hypothetical protein [Euryarchaeota archaeon]|tara:strand:- start:1842 stop:2582 length:741 start_codon:yes stop_codon:yes gene_type:complete